MRLEIEVWLRGNDFATTDIVETPLGPPRGWADDEVRVLLKELLRAVDRAKIAGRRSRPSPWRCAASAGS